MLFVGSRHEVDPCGLEFGALIAQVEWPLRPSLALPSVPGAAGSSAARGHTDAPGGAWAPFDEACWRPPRV